MAGVSVGTVDRVIHNRGNLSEASKMAVEDALRRMNYKTNIHVSAISLKKKYRVVIAIPAHSKGEYWELVCSGINFAIAKYSGLNITCEYSFYDQFDLFSCRKAFEKVPSLQPDAVIIGPTFRDEAICLVEQLQSARIPYIFIDSMIDGTTPLAYFIADPFRCGRLMGHLITDITEPNSEIAIMQAVRVGDESANITIIRKSGFMDYCAEHSLTNAIHRVPYSALEPELNKTLIGDFFQRNSNVKGAVVMNSRGHIIADYLDSQGITDVKIVGIDVLEKNCKAVLDGKIQFLIGQRPIQQGFSAMKTLFEHLVYHNQVEVKHLMPLDIVTQENVEIYSEFSELLLSE